MEVEITDFNLRKIIETLVVDWPASQTVVTKPVSAPALQPGSLDFSCTGLELKLRVKKDVSTVKLLGISCKQKSFQDTFSLHFELDDLQLLH